MARKFTVQITGEDAIVTRIVEGVGRVKKLIERVTGEEGSWGHENVARRLAHMKAGEAYSPTPGILVTVQGRDDGDEDNTVEDLED